MPRRATPTSLIALVGILVVAAVLRFAQLGSKALWLDEAMTTLIGLGRGPSDVPIGSVRPLSAVSDIFTRAAGRGIGDVVRELRDPAVQHTHPPLYYALLHSWFAMHAPSRDSLAWWARAPSAIFGLLAVVLVYFLGRTVASERAAIVAATLAAVSPLMVMISQEARNYTLPLACVAAACWCLAALVHQSRDEQPTGPWLWIGWTTANTLGCYAHYYVLLSVVAQAIAIAVVARRRPARQFYIPLAISSLAIGVAFLPWAGPFAAHTRTPEQGWMHEPNPIRHLYSLLVALQAMLQGWPLDSPAPQFWWLAARVVIGIAILTMVAVGAWRFLRGCDNPAATAMAWIAIVTIAELLAASAFQQKNLAGEQRYHFVYYPPLVALFGAALASVRPRVTALIVALGLLNSVLLIAGREFPKLWHPRETAALLNTAPGPALVVMGEASFHETVTSLAVLRELALQHPAADMQFLFIRRSDRYPTFVRGDGEPETFWARFLAANAPLPPTVWVWTPASLPETYRLQLTTTAVCTMDGREANRTLEEDEWPRGPFRLYRCAKP